MDARNYIYRMEWADFQLDVILPADGFATSNLPLLENPEIRTLPYGAITVNTLEWGKYEAVGGLPIGIPNPAVLKLTLDLSLLPTEITTVLFEDPAKYPLKDNAEGIDITNLCFDIGKGNRGIVFHLYKTIGFNLWCIYRNDGTVKINYSNLMMEIEAIDINKFVLDNITHIKSESDNLQSLNYAVGIGKAVEKFNAIEFYYLENDKSYTVVSNDIESPHKLIVCTLANFYEFISKIASIITQRITRHNIVSYFKMNYPLNYKQAETKSGGRSYLLDNDTEVYLLIAIISEDKIVGGILCSTNPDNDNSIFTYYKGGLWDFMRDTALESLQCYDVFWNGIHQLENIPSWSATERQIDLKYHKFSELILRDDPIKVVTASLYESASDTGDKTYKDISKYDTSIPGSENEASTTIPIIFNNLPPQLNYKKYTSKSFGKIVYAREGSKVFNLYYIQGVNIERVHEWSTFTLNLYPDFPKSSDDYLGIIPYIERDIHNGHLYENIQLIQLISGNGISISTTLQALLSNGFNKLTGVEFDLEHYLFPPNRDIYYFDLSSFFLTVPEDLTRRWMMNSCKIDFMKATATCDFIELNV